MCSQIRPAVVYLILQELIMYSKINKPKSFEKSVTSFFSETGLFYYCLRANIILNKNIWDRITIVVAINSLHKDFDPIIFRLLGQEKDRIIDKIRKY